MIWLSAHSLGENLAMQVMCHLKPGFARTYEFCFSIPVNSSTKLNGRDLVPRSTLRRGHCRRPCSPGESGPTTAGKFFRATEGSACVEADPRKEQGRKHGLRYRDHKQRP